MFLTMTLHMEFCDNNMMQTASLEGESSATIASSVINLLHLLQILHMAHILHIYCAGHFQELKKSDLYVTHTHILASLS